MNNNLSPSMPATGQDEKLDLVREVAQARRHINTLYLLVLKDAHADHHTLQAIGDAAGIQRSTVHTLVHGRAA